MISLETSRGLYKLVSSSFSKDCDFLVKIISYFDFVKNAIKTKVVKKTNVIFTYQTSFLYPL